MPSPVLNCPVIAWSPTGLSDRHALVFPRSSRTAKSACVAVSAGRVRAWATPPLPASAATEHSAARTRRRLWLRAPVPGGDRRACPRSDPRLVGSCAVVRSCISRPSGWGARALTRAVVRLAEFTAALRYYPQPSRGIINLCHIRIWSLQKNCYLSSVGVGARNSDQGEMDW